jgi:hypothetical protein
MTRDQHELFAVDENKECEKNENIGYYYLKQSVVFLFFFFKITDHIAKR